MLPVFALFLTSPVYHSAKLRLVCPLRPCERKDLTSKMLWTLRVRQVSLTLCHRCFLQTNPMLPSVPGGHNLLHREPATQTPVHTSGKREDGNLEFVMHWDNHPGIVMVGDGNPGHIATLGVTPL